MIKTIDEYIACYSGEIANRLNLIRQIIKENAPRTIEKISYRMPTFYLNGNLVHFAVHKNHIGFYPAPSAISHFDEQLKEYKTSKGAIQFPFNLPLPLKLIADIVVFRVSENQAHE